jgi:hypothetical protein
VCIILATDDPLLERRRERPQSNRSLRVKPWPGGIHKSRKGAKMPKQKNPNRLTSNQREMLHRRGINPNNFELVKETYCSLYVRDIRTGKTLIIFKHN